jgi:hypothetical protein
MMAASVLVLVYPNSIMKTLAPLTGVRRGIRIPALNPYVYPAKIFEDKYLNSKIFDGVTFETVGKTDNGRDNCGEISVNAFPTDRTPPSTADKYLNSVGTKSQKYPRGAITRKSSIVGTVTENGPIVI